VDKKISIAFPAAAAVGAWMYQRILRVSFEVRLLCWFGTRMGKGFKKRKQRQEGKRQ